MSETLEYTQIEFDTACDDAYQQGFEDCEYEGPLEIPDWTEAFVEALRSKSFEPLDGVEVKWDAALKALVFTQKGREVIFR